MADKQTRVFIHTDGQNLFYRQIKMTNPAFGIDSRIGMALHMILHSMKKEFTTWGGTHTVFYMEGRSWRKEVYTEYKGDRKATFEKQTEKEQEDFGILLEAFNDLVAYLNTKTNVTVLKNPRAEADDMIAVFIEAHPDDFHVLISSDSDFFQLLKYPNVMLYDPVKDIQIKQDGIYDDNNKRLSFTIKGDAKIKVGEPDPTFVCEEKWYEWALFLKCIRGDHTDYIFSAYPGVREKGTKKNIGIREAYNDKNKGYAWNNFMQQKFIDHHDIECQVKDKYEFNRSLIDLAYIPDDVKMSCLQTIADEISTANIPAVEIGSSFYKFAGRWDLKKISDNAKQFMPMLLGRYTK